MGIRNSKRYGIWWSIRKKQVQIRMCKRIGTGLNGTLNDDDIDTFNAYLEGDNIKTACRNTDWKNINNKIVGHRSSKKLKQWMTDK